MPHAMPPGRVDAGFAGPEGRAAGMAGEYGHSGREA